MSEEKRPQKKSAPTGKGKNNGAKPKPAGGGHTSPQPPQPFNKSRSGRLAESGSALSFAAGVLLLSVFCLPGKSVWLWLHNVYCGVFGIGSLVIPLMFFAAAIALSFDSVKNQVASFGKYMLAVGVVLLTSWHILGLAYYNDSYLEYTSWGNQITNEFYAERIFLSGGAFGALLGAPLGKLGKAPALIILAVILITLILLWSRKNVVSAAKIIGKAGLKVTKKTDKSDKSPPKKLPAKKRFVEDKTTDLAETKKSDGEECLPEVSLELSRRDKEVLNIFGPQKEPPKKIFITPDPESGGDEVYHCPPLSILKESAKETGSLRSDELEQSTARTLIGTLASFGVRASIEDISRGPSVTRYELVPEAGVRINRITNLADDIALRLAAVGVRIEAPIPGKSAIGIEVPNKQKSVVGLREILDSAIYKRSRSKLNVALGRDISGNVVCADLAKMPHLLIAGTTGSGKSVCMNTMIISLLFNASPDEVRMLMIDPKQVEFSIYNGVPHLEIPVVSDARKAAGALTWAVGEMEKRYKLLAERGTRDIGAYNDMSARSGDFEQMTRIVIFIDELADLMMIAPKEVEDSICRLAQKARAAGIHLVIATQRPSVDVITGLIKANIPSRIALSVSSQVDSRTILDMSGAEKLLGYGDMLFLPVDMQKPVRVQGCYISDAEVEQVVHFVSKQTGAVYDNSIQEEIEKLSAELGKPKRGSTEDLGGSDERDDMFEEAVRVVVEAGMASTTLLQRRLKLGYARASRVIDELEQAGVVGPFEGSKPRKVLISKAQYHERTALGGGFAPQGDEPPPWDD